MFARGQCSPDAFIHELSAQCAVAPDFIWDVLALVDQYHRRGKISAEFRRSVRELIERPALTHEAPPPSEPQPAPPGIVSLALVAVEPTLAAESKPASEVQDARTTHEPLPPASTSLPKSSTPAWAADGQIIVPILHEYRRPAPREKPPEMVRNELIVALADERPQPTIRTDLSAPLAIAAPIPAAAPVKTPDRPGARAGRTIQIAALSVVLSCVAASTALSDLARTDVPVAQAEGLAPTVVPATISLSSERYIAYPGSKSVVIEVSRTGDASKDVRFVWWTRSSGAKSGQDYIGSRPRTEHLAPGATSTQWTIPILSNAARRHTEMFYVFLGSAGDADTGSTTQATVFIMGSN